jgi:hypothetical protein
MRLIRTWSRRDAPRTHYPAPSAHLAAVTLCGEEDHRGPWADADDRSWGSEYVDEPAPTCKSCLGIEAYVSTLTRQRKAAQRKARKICTE